LRKVYSSFNFDHDDLFYRTFLFPKPDLGYGIPIFIYFILVNTYRALGIKDSTSISQLSISAIMSYTLKSKAMKSSPASSSVDRTTGTISYKPFAVIYNINTVQNPMTCERYLYSMRSINYCWLEACGLIILCVCLRSP
jgi:hypothetical protein